ncbi:MAG: hypothetical protein AAF804_15240 [Bacteroidota bacterium]
MSFKLLTSFCAFLFYSLTFFQPCLLAQPETCTLFHAEDMIKIKVTTDLKSLFRDDEDDRDYHAAQFLYFQGQDSVAIPVRTRVRGNFRRSLCKLPPLRLNFKDEDVEGTPMQGVDKIKMVLPCRWGSDSYQNYILKEYLIYRMFNLLTDTSFRVRLFEVTFQDSVDKVEAFTQYGFFIEPLEVLSARLGAFEYERVGVLPNATLSSQTNLLSVYQYMVGNTDWSIPSMHNIKMIKTDSFRLPVVIPYDFDWSGAVNPPYAQPNPKLNIKSVRERIYRGFCRPEKEMNLVYQRFAEAKEEIYSEIQTLELMDEKERQRFERYIEEFFDVLEKPKRRNYVFMSTCRK